MYALSVSTPTMGSLQSSLVEEVDLILSSESVVT